MSGNKYKIEIELPESDRMHSRDDRHLAMIVSRGVQGFLTESGPVAAGECIVRIVRSAEAPE